MNLKTKNIIILVVLCLVGIIGLIAKVQVYDKKNCDTIEHNSKKTVLHLNNIGHSANGISVKKVTINKNKKNIFGNKKRAYRVSGVKYTKDDLSKIAEYLDSKIKESELENDILSCNLANGGHLMYYKNSGSITYIANDDVTQEKSNVKKINKQKCINIAKNFIKKSNIIDYKQLEMSDVQEGYTIETNNEEYPISYQIIFKKKVPQEEKGFVGVGPGIRIDVNANYEIVSFSSINKELSMLPDYYDTLTLNDVEKKIEENKEVQIITNEEEIQNDIISEVSIEDVDVCLYSDPVNLEQKYMAPHYVLKGKNKSNNLVSIVLPAVLDKDVVIG